MIGGLGTMTDDGCQKAFEQQDGKKNANRIFADGGLNGIRVINGNDLAELRTSEIRRKHHDISRAQKQMRKPRSTEREWTTMQWA